MEQKCLQVLLVRASDRVCSLPLTETLETMRPLPTQAIGGVPSFVRGLSIIRGEAIPVLDLEALLTGSRADRVNRFVLLRLATHRVALAVAEVVGVRQIDLQALQQMPFLVRGEQSPVIQMVGSLDRELLMVLETSRLLSEQLWQSLAAPKPPS